MNEKIVDIDLDLRRGDFRLGAKFMTDGGLTAIFGRSGAGKTSIIDCIAGLLKPERGHIRIDGETLFDSEAGIDLPPEKRRIGYIFQDARLFPHMLVRANLEYGMKGRGSGSEIMGFDGVVDLLGISHLLDRHPSSLSGGETQRVAIGRALLSNPCVLLMDEPLSALDADRRAEIMPYIENLRDNASIPIVYVSHSVEEVVRLADSMVVMAEGKSIASGDIEDIMSRLDLRPHTGRYEAGAVIHCWVSGHDDESMLSELGFGAGSIWVPKLELERGTPLRLRIRARDVTLALERPSRSSTLNIFEGNVVDIEDVAPNASPHVDVLVNVGAPMIARITRKALNDLEIGKGQRVFVSIKTSAIDRHSLGLGRRR